MEGRNEVAELLIAKGTDVNTTNDDGESLLKLATFPKPTHSSANSEPRQVKN